MELISNINFNNKFASKVDELFLFYRLRFYASYRGGCIDGFKFTKNEKYHLIKKLVQRGWVRKNRVVGYRKICNRNECLMVWVRIKESDIVSKESFKGFLIAQAEAYDLTSRLRSQQGKRKVFNKREKTFDKFDWENGLKSNYWLRVKKIKPNVILGRSFNSNLKNFLGISVATITRWRKFSENTYCLRTLTSALPYYKNRDIEKMYRSKDGKFITKDLTVSTSLDVFIMSFCKPIEYLNNYNTYKSINDNVETLFLSKSPLTST